MLGPATDPTEAEVGGGAIRLAWFDSPVYRTIVSLGAVALTATALAACSSSAQEAPGGFPTDSPASILSTITVPHPNARTATRSLAPTTPAAEVRDYEAPRQVIAALRRAGMPCANRTDVPGSGSYYAAAAECTVDGQKVAIVTFSQPEQRAEYMRIGEAGGGAYPHYVLGTTWAVATLTARKAHRIADALGGRAY
jgi:hypothetical protein